MLGEMFTLRKTKGQSRLGFLLTKPQIGKKIGFRQSMTLLEMLNNITFSMMSSEALLFLLSPFLSLKGHVGVLRTFFKFYRRGPERRQFKILFNVLTILCKTI